MKIGFMFSGQGAQYAGMGKELSENFPQVQDVYTKANEVLGYDIAKLCFEGPAEELVKTKYSQPAILTTSIACLFALKRELVDLKPIAVSGLSLGEYSALVSAGALDFSDALRLVQNRADFMQEASELCNGGMASVMGVSEQEVRKTAGDKVDIANLNCPGQVVISGDLEEMKEVMSLFKKVIQLKVNGPFHSRLMEPARVKLEPFIKEVNVKEPEAAFIANVTGAAVKEPDKIKDLLIRQVTSSVYWEKSVRSMISLGIDIFIEIGPGKILGGLLRRIDKNVRYFNVEDLSSLRNTAEGLSYVTG